MQVLTVQEKKILARVIENFKQKIGGYPKLF